MGLQENRESLMEIVEEKGVVVDLLADLVWELEKVKDMLGRGGYLTHFQLLLL